MKTQLSYKNAWKEAVKVRATFKTSFYLFLQHFTMLWSKNRMYFPIGVGWVAVKILTTRKIPRNQDRSVFIMGQPKPLLGFLKGFCKLSFQIILRMSACCSLSLCSCPRLSPQWERVHIKVITVVAWLFTR